MTIYMAHVGAWFLFWFVKFYIISTIRFKSKRAVRRFDIIANVLIALIFGAASYAIHKGFFLMDCVCQ